MFCPNCGTKNDDDSLFCANCGTKLEAPAPVEAPAPASAPEPVPVAEPAPVAEAEPVASAEPAPAPTPEVEEAPAPASEPAPVVEPVPAPEPVPAAEPVPAPAVEPAPAAAACDPIPTTAEIMGMENPVPGAQIPNTAEPIGQTVAAPAAEPIPAPETVPAPQAVPAAEPLPAPPQDLIPSAAPIVTPQAQPQPQPQPIPTAAPIGSPQPIGNTAQVTDKPKKKIKPWMFIAGGGAALLVILLIVGGIIAATMLGGGGSAGKVNATYCSFYDPAEDITYLFYKDKAFKSWFEGYANISERSADQKVALITDSDENLYYATSAMKMGSVCDKVKDFTLSADGSTVAYLDEDNTLYTYNIKSGRTSTIAYDVSTTPVISPSGKALLFNIEDDGDEMLYAYNGRKDYKLTRDVMPVAISDDMKLIYYADPAKAALYITDKNGNSNKISADLSYYSFAFNKDLSQVMFVTENGLYASVRGGDKCKISSNTDGMPYPLACYGPQEDIFFYGISNENSYTYGTAMIYPESTFIGQFFYSYLDKEVFKIGRDWSYEKTVGDVQDIRVDRKTSILYYTNSDDTLYRVRLAGNIISDKIKEDINEFEISGSGSDVYYIDEDYALYYQKGNGKPRKIADDVDDISMTYDDYLLYVTDYSDHSGELYYCKGAKKKKLNDECGYMRPLKGATFFGCNYNSKNDTYDIYVTGKGVGFNLILQEVQ